MAAVSEARKTVTIVRCDVTGSTALGEQLDPEAMRRVMERYFGEMRGVVERHEGTVEKFIGDAVVAVFGIPQVHEDDALRAVRSADEMRAAVDELNDELELERGVRLQVRTAVTTGEVIAGDPSAGQTFVTGDAANLAARLEAAAEPGEILISEATYGLVPAAVDVEEVEPFSVKGKAEPVRAWRLIAVRADAEPFLRRLDTPMVGRTDELASLRQAFARAQEERRCELVTLVGEAGVGKSRLSEELIGEVQATVLRGRCLPYGEGITYWPLVEMLRDSSFEEALKGEGEAELIVSRIRSAIGLGDPGGGTEETFWAVRKLFEGLARESPLVVCVDDVQWAETTLLDLLEHVAYLSRAAPILLLCLARLEFLESRPGWPGARVQLGPLSATESHELLTALETESAGDEALQTRIEAAAEGNPFFLEQMFAVEREGTAAAVPATIQALLGARLDRLRPEERRAVECAAVVGQEFWSGAVHHLSGVDAGRALLGLVRQELIRPRESVFAGEDAFEFVHLLVRDAAYASIPKEARADLHERVAGWLERNDVERGAGHGEIVGYHLEQAYRYRIELGPANDETLALAGRAGARLATAGRRAYLGGDTSAASGLLARAAALLPPNSAARDELLVSLAAALVETGDLESAGEAIEEMRVSSVPTIAALASIEGWLLQFHHEDFDPDRTLKDAEAAIRVFQAHGDDRGLARAWLLIGETGNLFGRRGEMAEGTRKSAEHARRAGDFRAEAEALRLFGGALVYGPTPVPEALGQLEPILGRNDLNLMVEAAVVAPLATLKAMAGEIDEARRLLERAREIYGELGLRFQLGRLGFMSSRVERRAGDLEAAQRELRESLEILTSIGETGRATTLAVELANIVCELGDQDEAMRLIDEVPVGHEHEPLLLATRGRILARVGETGTAERLVERAVELAAGTDDHDHHAEAMLALGEVRAAIGKTAEAASALEGAIELFRHKGDVVFERKTLCLLAQLQGEPLPQRD